MKFKVTVEKRMYCSGTVVVNAEDEQEALDIVSDMINDVTLTKEQVEWSEPTDEDGSFEITGDVE